MKITSSLIFTFLVFISNISFAQSPVANDDSNRVAYNTNLNVAAPGVLSNDSGSNLSVVSFNAGGNNYPAGSTVSITGGDITINSDGSYIFAPSSGFQGSAGAITYTITDGTNTDTGNLQLQVNYRPHPRSDSNVTTKNSNLNISAPGVLNNDIDTDGDPLTVTTFIINGTTYSAGQTAHITEGDIRINADGSYSFSPAWNYTGSVPRVRYYVTDGYDTRYAYLYLRVNTAPVANDDQITIPTDGSINQSAPGLMANDTDPDGNSIHISNYTVNGVTYNAGVTAHLSEGDLTINSNGSYTFVAAAGYAGNVPTVTYTVSDWIETDTAHFNITVSAPPVAVDDHEVTTENTTLNDDVTNNDSDPEGDTLSVVDFVVNGHHYGPGTTVHLSQGDITINADGTYTFVPSTNYTGFVPTITYTISDGTSTDAADLDIIVDYVDITPIVRITSCNQGYTASGHYKIRYNFSVNNHSYAYSASNLQVYDDLEAVFGNHCITNIERRWIGTGDPLGGQPRMWTSSSWDTNEFDASDNSPGRQGIFNSAAVNNNVLYPRETIYGEFCVEIDPNCAGGAGVGSGNGVAFDNVMDVHSSIGNGSGHLNITDFHTYGTTLAASIYVPNTHPPVNPDGTYDFDLQVIIKNDGTAVANNIQFFLPLSYLVNQGVPINTAVVTQTSGAVVALNGSYDPSDLSGTNTGILGANVSMPAGTTTIYNIHYNVGPTAFTGWTRINWPNPSITQGPADYFPGSTAEDPGTQSYIIWDDSEGHQLDRYERLDQSSDMPSSEYQCNCNTSYINFNSSLELHVDKTINSNVQHPGNESGNRDITYQITINNDTNSDVQVENIVLTDDLAAICGPSKVIFTQTPVVVSSNATSTPIVNAGYNGVSDINIFDNTSGILEPGQSITVEIQVEMDDPCFGVNDVSFSGSDPSGGAIPAVTTGVETEVYSDFDNDLITDNIDIDDDNDSIEDTDEACTGLNGYYWGTNHSIGHIIDAVRYSNTAIAPFADFIVTSTDFNNGNSGLGNTNHLQSFLGSDASSLSTDPGNNNRAIIKLFGYVYLEAGTHNFRVRADDGYRIRVNNNVVAIYDGNQPSTTRVHPNFTIGQTGYYPIEILYWDAGGSYALEIEERLQGNAYHFLNNTNTKRDCDFDLDGNNNNVDLDSDNDAITDITEALGTDIDQDGQVDYNTSGNPRTMTDADHDGLSDTYDITQGGTPTTNPDTDLDNHYDFIDIDADADGIPDYIEAQASFSLIHPNLLDTDGDGIDDAYDIDDFNVFGIGGGAGTYIVPVNTDGADTPDYIDTNSDGDVDVDAMEGWDTNNDLIPDTIPSGNDSDNDGLDDAFDHALGNPDPTNSNQTASNFPDIDTPGNDRDWREKYPNIKITKDDQLPYTPQSLAVGNVITYNLNVINAGNVPLTNVTITDVNANVTGSPIASIAAYSTTTIQATHSITQADIDAGQYTNSANVSTDFEGQTYTDISDDTDPASPNGDDDATITFIEKTPELTVLKDDQLNYSPQNLVVGSVINYQITVTNSGNVTLNNISVSDLNANISGGTPIAVLSPGESANVTATHSVTQIEIDAGQISNSATATTTYEGNTISDLSDDTDALSPNGVDDPTVTFIIQSPSLVVTKNDQLAYTPQNLDVSDDITYQISVTNTGNVTLNPINLTDASAVFTSGNTITNLAPNATQSLTVVHTVTQADLNAGFASNSATADTTFNGQNYSDISDDTDIASPPGDDDPTNTLLIQNPSIEVLKDDALSYLPQNLSVNDVVTYTINVSNNGNVDLTNIVINDPNATFPSGNIINTLDVNQNASITATHTITQADIDAGEASNSATGDFTFNGQNYSDLSDDTDPASPGGNDDATITHIIQSPELTVIKDDQLPYTAQNFTVGSTITYQITVTNTGNVTVTGINVTDANATITAGSLPIASLSPGDSATITATHDVTAAEINAGQVSNSAIGSVVFNSNTYSDTSEDNDINSPVAPDDPTITHIIQNPEITVTKDDQLTYIPQNLQVGNIITYQIHITNTGNVDLTNISVFDANASISGSNIIANLGVGETTTLTATHLVSQSDVDTGQVSNSANASVSFNGITVTDVSDDTDPSSPTNDDDPTITFIQQLPSLVITKDDQLPLNIDQNMDVGDVINYIITINNNGNVTLNSVTLVDNHANITSGTPISNLAPGTATTVTATHTITQNDLNTGRVVNSAVASTDFNGITYTDVSDDVDPNSPTGNDDDTITNLVQNPEFVVTKDDGLPYSTQNLPLGSTITYDINVTNIGNVRLNNITINDTNANISGLTFVPSLDVNQTQTLTATHVVTQADIDAGFVSNSATGTTHFGGATITDISDDTDLNAPNGNDDPTITHLLQLPELTVSKDDLLDYSAHDLSVGYVINYQIIVRNTGNVSLTNINVTDSNANIVNGNPIAALAPGINATVSATHIVTQTDIDAGQIVNSAIANTDFNGNNITDTSDDLDTGSPTGPDDPTITHLIQTPEITVTKDDQLDYAPQNLNVGSIITYQIIVKNIGNITLNNIVVTDNNAQIQGSNTINSIAPNQVSVLTATHTVTQAEVDAGEVSNSATASLIHNGITISDLSDDTDLVSPNGEDDPTITHIIQMPGIVVTKNDQLAYSAQNMSVNDIINYQIQVTNTGNVTLGLINVTDNNAVIISGNPIVNLAPNAIATVIAQHTITQADLNAGMVSNSASVTTDFNGQAYADISDDTDPGSPSGSDDPTVTNLIQSPNYYITKDDRFPYVPQNLAVGDLITYDINVINNGNVSLTNISLIDNNASIQGNNFVASLDPNQTETIIATHLVTQADVDTGYVDNSVTGSTTFNGVDINDTSDDSDPGAPANDDDPTHTLIVQNPNITLTKNDQLDYSAHTYIVNDVVTYQITIINSGNVTLTNINLTDANASISTGIPVASLAPGAQTIITATHIVTQDDINLGQISNTATASTIYNGQNISDISDDTDPASPSGPDDPTITHIIQNPVLVVTKDDQMDYTAHNLALGSTFDYQIHVQNIGNVTLQNINVTDNNATINGSHIITTLEPNEIVTLTATHTVSQLELDAGEIINSATVSVQYNGTTISDLSDDTDIYSPNGDDDPTVTHLEQNPSLILTKDDQLTYSAQNMSVGQVITYHIDVTNTGNVTLSTVNISDVNANIISGNPVVNFAPGAIATVLATHTITQADLNTGFVSNSATADADFNAQSISDISDDPDPNAPVGNDDPTITTLVQNPSIVILKDDGLAYSAHNFDVGDVISYNINVTNDGNVQLSDITITDANANIIGSNIISSLDINETVTLSATHTVTQADINNGLISNSAIGTTTFNHTSVDDISDDTDINSPTGDDDPTITHIIQSPEITVTKDDLLPYTEQNLVVGDPLNYQIIVKNTGNVSLTDIDVTDSNATIISGNPILSLTPNNTATIVVQHIVTQADVDAGFISNSATATTSFNGQGVSDISDDTDIGSPIGDDDPTITHITRIAEVTITKDDQMAYSPQNLHVGDIITYQIITTNTGNVNLSNITVSDNNANIVGSGNIPSLAPEEFVTITATHTVTQADVDAGEISNSATARVQYNGLMFTDLSDDTDLYAPNGDDDPTITHIIQTPGIELTKDDQLAYTAQNMSVNGVITYRILVTNTGNVTENLVNISDNNASIISGNPITNLVPGATATVIATHTITQSDLNAGVVSNSATASTVFNGQTYSDLSDDTDSSSPLGNDDPTRTTLLQNPSIVITKDDGLDYGVHNLSVGDDITYSINVTNDGNVALNNITLTDANASIPGSTNFISFLDVNQTATISATHTVTQTDIDAGLVSNTVTGTTTFAGNDVTDISDDADVNAPAGDADPTITHINQINRLEVLKDDQLTYTDQNMSVGDLITYQITVTNNGNTTLTNIDITDNNATIISGSPILSLAPGAPGYIIATHEITQADMDAGQVSNSATATTDFNGNTITDLSDDTDPGSPSGNDNPTITHITQLAKLTVTKDDQMAYAPQNLRVGDVITYVISVKNSGNVTLNNVLISDNNANITGTSNIVTLAPEEIVTFEATHIVTQADINAGEISNSALASVQYNGVGISDLSDDTDLSSPSGADDPTITHIIQTPGLVVTKNDQLPYTAQNMSIGSTITYRIKVANTGNVTLNLVNVSDNNANIISGNPIVSFAPGAIATVIATHTITQADLDAGKVINSATASTEFNGQTYSDISDDTDTASPLGNNDPTITFLIQTPHYFITKDDGLDYGLQNMVVGDIINYNINVTNDGNVSLHDITLTDNNASIPGSTNFIASLLVDETVTISATHVITQTDIDNGEVSNSVSGITSFNNVDYTDISDDTDVNSPNGNDDPTITHIIRHPQLTVIKDDHFAYTDQNLSVGDIITYQIDVTNTGNVTLSNIDVTDANANIVSGTPIITLAPGDTSSVIATHEVTQADIDAGFVSNSATAQTGFNGHSVTDDSDDPDIGAPVGNDDPTITHIAQTAKLTVTKDDQMAYAPQNLSVGDIITYEIFVKNEGNVSLHNVQVTDNNAHITGGSVIANLVPDQTVTIEATHAVTQADINAGEISNAALASVQYHGITLTDLSDDTDLYAPSGDDDPTITHIIQMPGLEITKDDQLAMTAQDKDVGDIINYRIVVTNTGNTTFSLINVSDNNANIVSGNPIINLLPDNAHVVIAQHIVTQDDLNAGSISNAAMAVGDFNGQAYSDLSDDTDPNSPAGHDDPTITLLTQNPSFVITKNDGLDYIPQIMNAGDIITYTINVINNGNIVLHNVVITDNNAQISGINNIPNLFPEQTVTLTATHTVTQDDINTGFVSNSASGITAFNNLDITDISDDTDIASPAGNDDPTITYILQKPKLTVTKDDQLAYTNQNLTVGYTVNYQIAVTNSGNTSLTNINISDPNANIISGNPIAILQPGETAFVTANHNVTQTDIDTGQISNSATASTLFASQNISDISDDLDPASPMGADDPTITFITQAPALVVTKDDQLDYTPQNLTVGELVNYQIIVTNTGNVTLDNIIVTDNNANISGGNTIVNLAPDQLSIINATHQITQSDVDAGEIVNSAFASTQFNGITYNDTSDDTDVGAPNGDDDPTITHILQTPEIVATKDDQLPYLAQNMTIGDVITYRIMVTNTGNVTFNVVNVTDANANVISGNPILNLAPDATATVIATHAVTQADLDAGYVSNSALVSADFNGHTYTDISDDTDPGSPIGLNDPTITNLIQTPDITIIKDDGLLYIEHNLFAGDVINYTIVVTNTGNVTITDDITLTDSNAQFTGSNIIPGLAVGASVVLNATHIVTQADIDAGIISNSVLGETNFGNIIVTDLSDDAENISPPGPDDPTLTFIDQTIDFFLTKDDQLNYVAQVMNVGDIINYNIVVTNMGNVTLTNMVVDDPNALLLTGNPVPNLAPGTFATITAIHSLTQTDIDNGYVNNSATISTNFNGQIYSDISDDTDPQSPVGDDDPTITHIQKSSGLTLTKIGTIQTIHPICPMPGDNIIYTFEVRNAGNQNISNIHIQDPLITNTITYISGDVDGNNQLGQGEIWIFTTQYPLTQSMIDLGYVENRAYVYGTDPQNNVVSDVSDDPTNPTDIDIEGDGEPDDITKTIIPQHADIILLKEGHFNDENDDALADIGETITYTFTVKNRCNVTMTEITVDDPLIDVNPGHIMLPAQAEDNTTFYGTYIITLADIARGYVINTATATGIDPSGNYITDISDDPTNFEDVDPDNDGEPDDPTIVITPNIMIYEILTPNDDGLNDFFRILGIESFPNSAVKIYNRWGGLVFQTSAYNNTDNYWEGKYNDEDKKLPVGVYYYVIDLGIKDHEKTYTGSVYLNR